MLGGRAVGVPREMAKALPCRLGQFCLFSKFPILPSDITLYKIMVAACSRLRQIKSGEGRTKRAVPVNGGCVQAISVQIHAVCRHLAKRTQIHVVRHLRVRGDGILRIAIQ